MVMAFFRYIAQEVRELLASLGLRSVDEAVGRTDLLRQRKTGVLGADMLDLRQMLVSADELAGREIRHSGERNPLPPVETLNDKILRDSQSALAGSGPIELNYRIRNCERTVGARLAGTIGQMYGEKGLPEGTVNITLRGSAGQSFGAFNAPGMHMLLIGEANDYVGKGMAGGEIAIRPPEEAPFTWCENVIAGNTILYGATGGDLYLAGRVGERFAVRNSGATAVVEGLGDHGCEYMTGGTVVVLGATGYNFGAGMTGGVAYVLDEQRNLEMYHNPQLVQLDRLNAQDELAVQTLVQRHLELTGSPRAAEILERWNDFLPQFWRVMPSEAVAKIEAASEGAASDGTASPKDKTKEQVAA
jgi:glutamate synthase (ferredoxin)